MYCRNYEVLIGTAGNSKTVLTRNGDESNPRASEDTDSILDCNTFKAFWIEWTDEGLITMGAGDLRMNEILRYQDLSFHLIHGISFDTKDTEGTWSFQDDVGEYDKS